jgi:hypothetical protein
MQSFKHFKVCIHQHSKCVRSRAHSHLKPGTVTLAATTGCRRPSTPSNQPHELHSNLNSLGVHASLLLATRGAQPLGPTRALGGRRALLAPPSSSGAAQQPQAPGLKARALQQQPPHDWIGKLEASTAVIVSPRPHQAFTPLGPEGAQVLLDGGDSSAAIGSQLQSYDWTVTGAGTTNQGFLRLASGRTATLLLPAGSYSVTLAVKSTADTSTDSVKRFRVLEFKPPPTAAATSAGVIAVDLTRPPAPSPVPVPSPSPSPPAPAAAVTAPTNSTPPPQVVNPPQMVRCCMRNGARVWQHCHNTCK